jgi:hypothetical protein
MTRFIFVAMPVGLIYADTKDDPAVTADTPIEALRQVDTAIGETDLAYTEVERGSIHATYDVYRAAGIVRKVTEDAIYVTSIQVSPADVAA